MTSRALSNPKDKREDVESSMTQGGGKVRYQEEEGVWMDHCR